MSKSLTADEKASLRKDLKPAFDVFDADKSGCIDCKEFESIVCEYNKSTEGEKLDPKKTAADFIAVADKNSDGKVSFEEFFEFICKALEASRK